MLSVRLIRAVDVPAARDRMMRDLVREAQHDPFGPPLFWIVPEQMTFGVERALVDRGLRGTTRLNVVSFTRLAWRVFQEVGGSARRPITSLGVLLLTAQAVFRRREALGSFGRAAERVGFYERLSAFIRELRRYGAAPADLDAFLGSAAEEPTLGEKLSVARAVYADVAEALETRYLDGEGVLRALARALPDVPWLPQAAFWVDGFYGFTPEERAVLGVLMRRAASVTLLFPARDPGGTAEVFGDAAVHAAYAGMSAIYGDLWSTVEATIEQLVRLAEADGVVLERGSAEGERSARELSDRGKAEGGAITSVFVLPTARHEVEAAAAHLRALARSGIPYRRMAVVTGDLERYGDLIEGIFEAADIPVFIDREKPMRPHPLVRFADGLLAVLEEGLKTAPVVRLLKTGLLWAFFRAQGSTVSAETVDRLENWLIAYGIRDGDWDKPYFGRPPETDGHPALKEAERRERIRRAVVSVLRPAIDAVRLAPERPAGDYVRLLADLLAAFWIDTAIEEAMEAAEGAGEVRAADEERQAWQALVGLLEQFDDVLGDTPMPFGSFARLMRFGLETQSYHLIPRTLDAVTVADVTRSRLLDVDVVVLLGAARGDLPPEGFEEGWLTEAERARLAARGLKLAPTWEARIREAALMLLGLFAEARRVRIVTVPEMKDGVPAAPAEWAAALMADAGGDATESGVLALQSGRPPVHALTLRQGLRRLADGVRALAQGTAPPDDFWPLYEVYRRLHERVAASDASSSLPVSAALPAAAIAQAARGIVALASGPPKRGTIDGRVAVRLFPPPLWTSVSQVERYHACPYAFFAEYGLGLKERAVHRLTYPDIGEVYHAALARLGPALATLAETAVDDDAARQLETALETAVEEALSADRRGLFVSDARSRAIAFRVKRHLRRTAKVAVEQLRRGRFRPYAFEWPLAAAYPLPGGEILHLRGRIDRIDVAEIGTALFVRLIDYKSRMPILAYRRLLAGLDLQLIVYLDVLLREGLLWKGARVVPRPAAAVYQVVGDRRPKIGRTTSPEDVEHLKLKAYQWIGWLTADRDLLLNMDATLPERAERLQAGARRKRSVDSAIMDVSLSLDLEAVHARAHLLLPDGWAALRAASAERLQAAASSIARGRFDVEPYQDAKDGQDVACRFCPYRAVCRFDPEGGDRYRRLPDERSARAALFALQAEE